jgi:hypothetical protein
VSVRAAAFLALLSAVCLAAGAQDADVDSLFEEPQEDIIAEGPPDTETDNAAAFGMTEKPVFTGRFEAIAGAAAGWTEFAAPGNLGGYWDATPYADADTTFYFDARPDQTFRLHGAFTSSLAPDSGKYTWTDPTVDELFVDYAVTDAVFVRFGNHTMSWGQGRLYTPGDLMADSDEGTALRVSLPTVLSGLSVVALAKNAFFADPTAPSYREAAYAALTDAVFGSVRASFGLRYRGAGKNPEGLRTLVSLKRSIFGTDVFTDAVVGVKDGSSSAVVLGGFFREWERLKLYGEYQFGSPSSSDDGQRAGLALYLKRFCGTIFDVGVKWLHAFEERSGGAALAFHFRPLKHVSATFAVPVVYGVPGRFDILDEDHVIVQRIGLIGLIKLTAPF